jgi:hypothetical protein
MAPAKIVQTRGGWPFFEVNVTSAKLNPPTSRRSRRHRPPAGRGGPGAGAPPAVEAAAVRRRADRHDREAWRRL